MLVKFLIVRIAVGHVPLKKFPVCLGWIAWWVIWAGTGGQAFRSYFKPGIDKTWNRISMIANGRHHPVRRGAEKIIGPTR